MEAPAQGESFVRVAETPEELPDTIRPLARARYRAQRGGRVDFAGADTPQLKALEFPATNGSLAIDPAPVVSAERGTRLRELLRGLVRPGGADGKAGGDQSLPIIGRLEFNVLEQNPIAAEAAAKAQQVGEGMVSWH